VSIGTNSTEEIGNAVRMAGLGVVSSQTNQLVLLGRAMAPVPTGQHVRAVGGTTDNMDELFLGDTAECTADTITLLKIEKRGPFVSLFCWTESQGWTEVKDNFKLDLGDIAKVFLFAYSTDAYNIQGEFYLFSTR
jgi:hypothetical protein